MIVKYYLESRSARFILDEGMSFICHAQLLWKLEHFFQFVGRLTVLWTHNSFYENRSNNVFSSSFYFWKYDYYLCMKIGVFNEFIHQYIILSSFKLQTSYTNFDDTVIEIPFCLFVCLISNIAIFPIFLYFNLNFQVKLHFLDIELSISQRKSRYIFVFNMWSTRTTQNKKIIFDQN